MYARHSLTAFPHALIPNRELPCFAAIVGTSTEPWSVEVWLMKISAIIHDHKLFLKTGVVLIYLVHFDEVAKSAAQSSNPCILVQRPISVLNKEAYEVAAMGSSETCEHADDLRCVEEIAFERWCEY
jgi:hypothetical protein